MKQCDSYFVESEGAQYVKMIGRRIQEAMANELSRQVKDAYVDSIVNHMKQIEVNNLGYKKSCFSSC